MKRLVEAEWLDQLPPADPRALGSRRDLKRINWLLGNVQAIAKASLAACPVPPRSIVELGAGDGTVALRLAKRLAPRWPGVRVLLLDRAAATPPATLAAIERLGWQVETVAADVFAWFAADAPRADIIFANNFLHHFADADLRALFAHAARHCRVFVGCDPRRSAVGLGGSKLLGLIGFNDVSRHDAVASVRAGFSGRDLSLLWPERHGWSHEEGLAGAFNHLFVARAAARNGG